MENPITLEEERKVWTIHQSVSGQTYYYNRATKKSQYEMPECFKTTEEATEHPDWKEYRTAEGKKFYYNASCRKSSWQLPNQVKQFKLKLEEKRKRDREENDGRVLEEENLSEAEEVKRKFLTLLKHKLIGINTKWDACIKLCEDDDTWKLLKTSDKKKYFNEYISDLKKINDMEVKLKTQGHRNQFLAMLRESKNLTSDCKMHKIVLDFITDSRWKLLEETERENTFQAYLDELVIKQKEEAKEKKLRNTEYLRETMQEDCVRYNMKWDEFKSKYKHNQYFQELHPYDRISAFVDYILDAERRQEEQLLKDKTLRERQYRVNYRNMLREKLINGDITYKTKWKGFINDFRHDKNLINMMDLNFQATTAHEIFEYFMQDIRDSHKALKAQIKKHFKKKAYRMTEETSNEEFKDKLSDLPEFMALKEVVKDYFHKYFQQKIKYKNQNKQLSAKKAQKKEKKTIFKIFSQLRDSLKNKYTIEDHMGKIEAGMKEHGISISHESIFKYYLAYLEGKEEDDHVKRSGSRSNSNSSISTKGKNNKLEQLNEPLIKIPNSLQENGNDLEEEGEIRDEEIEEKEKKKKPKSKKKRKNSSSSSD